MLNTIEPPLCFNFVPSVWLNRLVLVIFALALFACLANSLPLLVKVSLAVLTVGYFVSLRQRLKKRQFTFRYTDTKSWAFSETEEFVSIEILPSSVVTNYAVFLHFKTLGEAASTQSAVLLVADSLTDEAYRTFIVKLLTTAVKHRQALQSIAKINPIITRNSVKR
ncbi:MAG: hypothetical protein K9L60_10415 [Methylovulum sp.]|nr:hypothetical protein [Methylovulum sp.]MCF7999675.1 hypothetical protein [Methylovulum sp.]